MKSTKRMRKIEIEVERDELLVVKSQRKPIRAWCDQCGAEVEMVTTDEPKQISGCAHAHDLSMD